MMKQMKMLIEMGSIRRLKEFFFSTFGMNNMLTEVKQSTERRKGEEKNHS